MKNYKDQNLALRKMQIKYSNMAYTLPNLYKEKNEAYSKAFNTGKNFIVGYDTFIYRTHGQSGEIKIGNNVVITNHCIIDYTGNIYIGDNVTISDGVKIYSHNHDPYKYTRRIDANPILNEVNILNNTWIGAGSIILPGVTIGKYSVIGAGSVVTHDVPDYCVYAGNPAKYIKDNK